MFDVRLGAMPGLFYFVKKVLKSLTFPGNGLNFVETKRKNKAR
jgi:hypothetical protein